MDIASLMMNVKDISNVAMTIAILILGTQQSLGAAMTIVHNGWNMDLWHHHGFLITIQQN